MYRKLPSLEECPEGTRVKVFNARVYRDDKSTPLSITMQLGTVVRRYGYWNWNHRWTYPDMVDVLFDSDPVVSRGHFTDGVEVQS
jgi:hypothetical protein